MSRWKAWQLLVICVAYMLTVLGLSLWAVQDQLQASLDAAKVHSVQTSSGDYMVAVTIPAPWWLPWVIAAPPLLLVGWWLRERWHMRARDAGV